MTAQTKLQAIEHLADDVIAREQQLKTALAAVETLQLRLAQAERVATALETILGTPEGVYPFSLTSTFANALQEGHDALFVWRNGAFSGAMPSQPVPSDLTQLSDTQLVEVFRDEAVISGHYNVQGPDYEALTVQAIGRRQALQVELLSRLDAGRAVRAELEKVRQALDEHAGIEDPNDTLSPHVVRLAGYVKKYLTNGLAERKLRKQAEHERDEFKQQLSHVLADYQALLTDVEAGEMETDSPPDASPCMRGNGGAHSRAITTIVECDGCGLIESSCTCAYQQPVAIQLEPVVGDRQIDLRTSMTTADWEEINRQRVAYYSLQSQPAANGDGVTAQSVAEPTADRKDPK